MEWTRAVILVFMVLTGLAGYVVASVILCMVAIAFTLAIAFRDGRSSDDAMQSPRL